MSDPKSLQETYAPNSICFGCGPANQKGLQIRSLVNGDCVELIWTPQKHHEAFPGVLNGGVIGALFDCHSNWTAAYALMKQANLEHPPCTVTSEFCVKLLRPTPTDKKIFISAKVLEIKEDRAVIEASLTAEDQSGANKLFATCKGTFVAVKPGHPAHFRW
ncbi:MAG: PaaI family thioesterase [Bacteriovoracia bacterium]